MSDYLNALRQLIKAFAAISTTDDFIFFVAGTDRMLVLCQLLLEEHDRDGSSPLLREADRICAEKGVLTGAFYAEVRKVLLALNRFHDGSRDHYAVLGLHPDASREEVKRAYRQLSKKYHPDTRQDGGEDSRQFMEIAGAYHAIMAGSDYKPLQATPWRRPPGHLSRRRLRDRKSFFIMVGALICLLAGTSIYLAGRHSRMVMVSQWQKTAAMEKPGNGSEKETVPLLIPESIAREAMRKEPLPVPSTETFPDRETLKPAGPAPAAEDRQAPAEQVHITLPRIMQPPPEIHPPPAGKIAAVKPEMPAPAKPEAASEHPLQEKQDRIDTINTSLEINTLIKQYSTLYSGRRLSPFLDLFAGQAEENGRPLSGMTEKYRTLFARTRTIDLRINSINWNEMETGYQARGNFEAAYVYTDGRTGEYRGRITFLMVREQDRLKIKSLDYTFEE